MRVGSEDTLLRYSNVGNEVVDLGFEVTKEEMAGGEVEGLVYGGPHGPGRAGWVPVNAESSNPTLTLANNIYIEPQHEEVYGRWLPVDNHPIKEPSTQGLDFTSFEPHQKEINGNWVSGPINPWQQSNSVPERQPEQEEVYGVSRPIYPWQETNSILERQQEGRIFPSLQLSPRDMALGGIVLSLLVTAVIGWILAQPIINWRGGGGEGSMSFQNKLYRVIFQQN